MQNLFSYNYFPVLLLGETGTGKSRMAKTIFSHHQEKYQKFIHVNVAALSETLFESEMFGHLKGSFTDAHKDKIGFCEQVENGVLFLDEIGDLSLVQQTKLLTLLEEKIYYSVGSTVAKTFRGKLIFATNKNLESLVKTNQFREDLFYRIRFLQKKLPALRCLDKKHYIEKMTREYGFTLSDEVQQKLVEYNWPGNFRELKQTFEYFELLGRKTILKNDVPSWIEKNDDNIHENSYKQSMEQFERKYLKKALKENLGKINQTSSVIGLNKVTLISKLKKYGIDKDVYKQKLGMVSGL